MTDYIGNINIGNGAIQISGDNFDGNTVNSTYTILNDVTLSGNSINTYDLSSYLPDNDYDYLVTFSGRCNSGASSGNVCQLNLFSGTDSSSSVDGYRLGRTVARTSARQTTGGMARIVIFASDQNITVKTSDTTTNNAYCYLYAVSYRRVGKND